jgi:hypothetical protein
MTWHSRQLGILALILMATGCMTAQAGSRPSASHSPARNFCPDRLPVAHERIRSMYSTQGPPAQQDVEASVVGPEGTEFSVGVSADFLGSPRDYTAGPRHVHTGLADLVFNCGTGGFSNKECFIDVFLDGREITSMGPTTKGQVPIQCLPAGRHELVIKSVASTIFEGTIYLASDVEHLAKVEELNNGEYRFEIYAKNPIPGRIPEYRPKYRHDRPGRGHPGHRHRDRDDWDRDRDDWDRDRRDWDGDRRGRDDWDRDRRDWDRGRDDWGRDRGRDRDRDDRGRDDRGRGDDDHDHDRDDRDDDREWDDRDDHDRHRPMSESDFNDLRNQVASASFSREKLGVIRMAARHNWFTSDQVRRLVKAVNSSDSRVEVAVELYDRTVDKNRFHQVMSAFVFSSSRQEVRQRLGL